MIATLLVSALLNLSILQTPIDEPQMEYIGDYTVSAYNFYEGGGENFETAGGYEPCPYYTVAAPYDIPMGTILYIEDLGEVQVQDRGNFPSDWIDLNIGYDSIDSWDMRERKVYVVERSD